MNGDKSPGGGGQAPMVPPQSGTVDVEQSPMNPDWRAQVTLEDRQRIVDQLLETLEKHLPSTQGRDLGLKKIAERYEERVYFTATTSSRSEYLRKISSTMHALESNSQVPMANSLQTGPADDSTISSDLAQTESSDTGDWQEEVYQKIKSMKDAYFVELNAMYSRVVTRLQMHEGLSQPPNNKQLSMIKFFKVTIEPLLQFLQISKNEVQNDYKDKLDSIQKQITSVLSLYRLRNPTSLQPGQSLQPVLQNSQLQSQISQMQTEPLKLSSSVPIDGSLTNSLQQPSSTFGLEQNNSPLSLQLPQLRMQNSQPQSQISQMPTQSSIPQSSAATMAHNNFGALNQNTLSSVPSNSNSMTNHVQQPSLGFGLGQNSSMLSPQLPQSAIQISQPQSQISQIQAQPLKLSSSVPINGSLTNSLQQPSSTFGLEQNSSPLSLQLPHLGMQNSQPQSQISQMPTQSSIPQTSAPTMAHNNFGALNQNTVPSNSNSMTNHVQQPSLRFGLGQNSSMLSPQLPQSAIQISQPQTQKLQQTSAAPNQNMLSSVPSISNTLMNSVQQPSSSVGLGQNSSLISPQQVAVNSLQQNIALSGPQSSNPVGPLLSSQAGVNALPLSLHTHSGLLQYPYPNPQLQMQMLYQRQMQQQLMQQQLMNAQRSAQLPGHPFPLINQQNLVTSLTKTETPLQTANSSVVVTSSTPVAASPKHAESENVDAIPSPLSKNTTPFQGTKAAGSSTLTQAPGRRSLQINQHNSAPFLTKIWKPLPASTQVASSPVHAASEKVTTSLPSHMDTVSGHIQAPNSAGSSIANTNTGHLEAPIVAGSSVLPLSIFIGDSEIVSASLSSQPNTHILHLEAPNPADASAKPLAISITISIA